ncbi:hirsutellin A toxin [Dendryphion nanum]|uniref:Hirsutellin A toxin n=1 Tax=Dendryphion nanum TaxID=256645 RepID=A0A9P9DI89_9PLEO|nr:hirsutellin A toxin [Dendryphion nanum]
MHATTTLIALALAAVPAFAVVTCSPTLDGVPKPFKVDVELAQQQMQVAGITPGISGDPHQYQNGDHIAWPERKCLWDAQPASQLYEYPLFWVGSKQKTWEKDVKSSNQDHTPIRVVYTLLGGTLKYCGVMTHTEVDKSNQGFGAFKICS